MNSTFIVGDLLIDSSIIYQIFSIDHSLDSTSDDTIHYQPISGTDKIFTASIPAKNLFKSGLRRLMTKQDIAEFFSNFSLPLNGDYHYDPKLVKEDILANQPLKLIPHLQYLRSVATPTRGDSELFSVMVHHLCLEINHATGNPISDIKNRLLSISKS